MEKKSNSKQKKLPTGIQGFDEVLNGGFQNSRSMLITGGAGTGKTIFLNEFIYRGITSFNEPGVFVTFEEKPDYIIRNVESFGWNYKKLIKEGKLLFVDMSPDVDSFNTELGSEYELTPIIERIKYAVKQINAKRVVLDSLSTLYDRYNNESIIRQLMIQTVWSLNSLKVRSLISSEGDAEKDKFSRYGVEEYVADGVIGLRLEQGDQQFIRRVFVRKMRGESYRSGLVEFDITQNGIEVYPKIPMQMAVKETKYTERKKFGIKGLDDALMGGLPKGHVVLISGNTGAGKSILGLHFLNEGLKKKENAVFVSLEESPSQVKKTARQFGWNLEKYEKEGKLSFVTSSLIDVRPDRLLYNILKQCEATNAKRVVIDSVSSLESATFNKDKVRQFLIQITHFFKGKGITCLCNYLSGSNFGATKGQLLASQETNKLKLSSVMDGVLLLLYVERERTIEKLITVLKMRGSEHDKSIFMFDINKKGFTVNEKFVR